MVDWKYPEHEKLAAIREEKKVLTRFLEMLQHNGYEIVQCCAVNHEMIGIHYGETGRIVDTLAKFFDIDRNELAKEKDRMCQELAGIFEKGLLGEGREWPEL